MKGFVHKLTDDDHPATLKDIMTAPPTTPQAYAQIHKKRTENRRKVEDKQLEQAIYGMGTY